ncbi:hypothetical protein F503_07020 [Ophiostoma piceae UAMH 11346]|uniref:Uncharacterized protein n=1 Tax=Ophiostoma piceae (strain UAMH 11346) TaxID=1262450 RepID=S3C6W2_OPHP1|nr:hypothetical protein F503_07020 [Ophiostoma piceae UAMH 11346]
MIRQAGFQAVNGQMRRMRRRGRYRRRHGGQMSDGSSDTYKLQSAVSGDTAVRAYRKLVWTAAQTDTKQASTAPKPKAKHATRPKGISRTMMRFVCVFPLSSCSLLPCIASSSTHSGAYTNCMRNAAHVCAQGCLSSGRLSSMQYATQHVPALLLRASYRQASIHSVSIQVLQML